MQPHKILNAGRYLMISSFTRKCIYKAPIIKNANARAEGFVRNGKNIATSKETASNGFITLVIVYICLLNPYFSNSSCKFLAEEPRYFVCLDALKNHTFKMVSATITCNDNAIKVDSIILTKNITQNNKQ